MFFELMSDDNAEFYFTFLCFRLCTDAVEHGLVCKRKYNVEMKICALKSILYVTKKGNSYDF